MTSEDFLEMEMPILGLQIKGMLAIQHRRWS